MAETTLITLSTSAYTALGTTQTAVGCFVQPSQRVRLCVATSLPAANTTGFVAVEPASGEPYLFVDFTEFGIGSGDEVYALSEYGSVGLVVVRGTSSAGAAPATIVAPLGRAADAASVSVALSTEDVALLPAVSVATASLSALASLATSAQLLAANSSRTGLMLVNTDANDCRIKYGTTASASSFSAIVPGNNGYWEMPRPIYTGRIDAIWDADGSGSLFATEL